MSAPPAGETPYFRAGGGVQVDGRRVAVVVAAGCALVLAVVAVVMAVGAAHRNAQLVSLRRGGVPVQVTVTGCLGISSGVGMGIEYWQCRGSYHFGGRAYDEVIGGNRRLLERGQHVDAVVAASQPTVVSTASSIRRGRSSWTSFVVPAVLGVAAILLAAGVLVLSGRGRSRRPAGDG